MGAFLPDFGPPDFGPIEKIDHIHGLAIHTAQDEDSATNSVRFCQLAVIRSTPSVFDPFGVNLVHVNMEIVVNFSYTLWHSFLVRLYVALLIIWKLFWIDVKENRVNCMVFPIFNSRKF